MTGLVRSLTTFAACGYLLLGTATAFGAQAAAFSTDVPVLASTPSMNGVIDGSWAKARKLPVGYNFTYQRSGEPTVVYVAQDSTGLDVAFDVVQREALTATQNTNGAGVVNDDNVTVALWPQGAQGFAYTFSVNPLGARDQTSSENSAYSPEWTAAARRTPQGYAVTMHIPFGIMRNGGSHDWTAQFQANISATNSTQVWVHVDGQRHAQDPAYGGTLAGIAATTQAAAIRPRPRLQVYGLGELTPSSYGGNTSRLGADVAIPVTATSSLIGTFHPDYSNVEVDQQTIAPSTFARHFNEVRPFFTQAGQNFNQNFSCTNCPTTLYTPAIPTFREGYAYEGTQGRLTFAAFDAIGDARSDSAEAASYQYDSPGTIYSAAFQRVSVDLSGFHDDAWTLFTGAGNQKTHYFWYFNTGNDAGTNVSDPGFAQYFEYGGGYVSKNTTAGLTLQKIGPQFLPADGFVTQPGIAGYLAFYNRTLEFSPKATLQDIALNTNFGRFNDPSGNLAQTDAGAQVNFDLKNQLSIHFFENSQGVETSFAPLEFVPFNANGVFVSYKGQTSTPTSVQYVSGPYYHGHLTSWSYIATVPIMHRLNLSLETDENLYGGSHLAGEPSAKQWLERASLDWQFTRHASFDVGARRIIGANLPNAFQAPDLPAPVLNGPLPFDYTNAGNVSAAMHFLAAQNEFYVVYGNPNSLATTPALYLKWIRYIGAEKGV